MRRRLSHRQEVEVEGGLAWILVVVLSIVVVALLVARRTGGGRSSASSERSASTPPPAPPASRPTEADEPAEADASGPTSGSTGPRMDEVLVATRGLFRWVEAGVLPELHSASRSAGTSPDSPPLQRAIDALEDLRFYAEDPEEAEPRRVNVVEQVGQVIRGYTADTGIAVRTSAESGAINRMLAPGLLADVVFLLLANAGRFGEGRTVDVTIRRRGSGPDDQESGGDQDDLFIDVEDQGPGFGTEALEHAFEPFWSTDPEALGMGLAHARHLAGKMGGRLVLPPPSQPEEATTDAATKDAATTDSDPPRVGIARTRVRLVLPG